MLPIVKPLPRTNAHAHAALVPPVLSAYGYSARKDLLAQLFAFNHEVAAKIEESEPVTDPGSPRNYPDAQQLLPEDCLKPV